VPPPDRVPPDSSWKYFGVWQKVRDALRDIHTDFKSTVTITAVRATEIFTYGEVLGNTIEQEVVRTLNDMRDHWDVNNEYAAYTFVRQAGFPDVLLQHISNKNDIVMGIELKSWYLLAKEGEPSFRFRVSSNACAPADMICIVPWTFQYVVSGTPVVFSPFIESAKYLADYRNYWWQNVRQAEGDTSINSPDGAHPYPGSRDEFSDEPRADKGKNFGRIARMGIMDEYVRSFDNFDLLGIELKYWRNFFKTSGKAYTLSGTQVQL
jgi:hypothetical protein